VPTHAVVVRVRSSPQGRPHAVRRDDGSGRRPRAAARQGDPSARRAAWDGGALMSAAATLRRERKARQKTQ